MVKESLSGQRVNRGRKVGVKAAQAVAAPARAARVTGPDRVAVVAREQAARVPAEGGGGGVGLRDRPGGRARREDPELVERVGTARDGCREGDRGACCSCRRRRRGLGY